MFIRILSLMTLPLCSLGSDLRNLADPREAELLHLDSELEKIVETTRC